MGALTAMGTRKRKYSYETKVAAARAVADEGATVPEAMARFGIASASPLRKWARAYREEGPEALRPRPKGRPKGAKAASGPMTREQELERRVRKLEADRLSRSSYCCALAHPKAPTRPELWEAAAEMFSRTPNGCGHREMAMHLRAEQGAVIAGKTALKMMREMGIGCGIRREADRRRCSSYRGRVGKAFENVIGRDFAADGPW